MGCFTLVIVQTNRISCFYPQQRFFLSPSKTEKVGMFQHKILVFYPMNLYKMPFGYLVGNWEITFKSVHSMSL